MNKEFWLEKIAQHGLKLFLAGASLTAVDVIRAGGEVNNQMGVAVLSNLSDAERAARRNLLIRNTSPIAPIGIAFSIVGGTIGLASVVGAAFSPGKTPASDPSLKA